MSSDPSSKTNGGAGHRVCPWWLGYVLASPLRRLLQDPARILEPYIRSGMTVLEPGPGMGFFTLELARRVGPNGRVVAVDLQPKMIAGLRRRLRKAGLLHRVDTRVATADSMGLSDLHGAVDFTLAMAVVHETPGAGWFFGQIAHAMKPGASVLLAEPAGHVTEAAFRGEMDSAVGAGFLIADRPSVRRSQAALLQRRAS